MDTSEEYPSLSAKSLVLYHVSFQKHKKLQVSHAKSLRIFEPEHGELLRIHSLLA